jgi:hypothetical protein
MNHNCVVLGTRKYRILDLFMKAVPLCIIFFGIVIFLLAFFFPTIPPFLGKLIAQPERNLFRIENGLLHIGQGVLLCSLRLFVSFLTTMIFVAIMMGCWQVIMYEIIFSLLTLNSCLQAMKTEFSRAEANRGYLVPKRASILKQLQIFCTFFNSIYETRFFIYVLGLAQASMVLGGYSAIRSGNQIPFIIIVGLYAMTLIKYVIIGFFLTIAASTHVKSNAEIKLMQKQVSRTGGQMKYNQRLVKSLRPLKVNIGNVNFVDRLTPVVILCYVLEQTISLVIM